MCKNIVRVGTALDWLQRNWALARTRRTSSTAMIWVKRKICSRFVPHKLTQAESNHKLTQAESNHKLTQAESKTDGNFWRLHFYVWSGSIASGKHRHGRWDLVLQFDPESKRQSMAWCSPNSPRPKKNCLQKSKVNKGIIHKEFVPAGQIINAAFIWQFWTDCYCVSGEFGQSCTGLENGCCSTILPLHSAIRVHQFLTSEDGSCSWSPSLPPWSVSCGFLPVSPLEGVHQRCAFCGREAIKDRVKAVLWSIPHEAFADCFGKLYECCQTCVEADGDYFEGQ